MWRRPHSGRLRLAAATAESTSSSTDTDGWRPEVASRSRHACVVCSSSLAAPRPPFHASLRGGPLAYTVSFIACVPAACLVALRAIRRRPVAVPRRGVARSLRSWPGNTDGRNFRVNAPCGRAIVASLRDTRNRAKTASEDFDRALSTKTSIDRLTSLPTDCAVKARLSNCYQRIEHRTWWGCRRPL